MKNQKGVTLTVLVATVIVLTIIMGTISYNGISSYRMRVYYNMRSDIELLDEKISLYYLENSDNLNIEDQLPIDVTDTKNITNLISDYDEYDVNYNPNNSGTLYKIDLSKLENLSLSYDDYYIDTVSHTIYSNKAVNVGNETYYTIPYEYTSIS